MKLTDALAKTFQLCWVTNDLDRAMAHFKTKFDVERFLIMNEVPFVDLIYRGATENTCDVRAAWANAGNINLELVEPRSGFAMDLYGHKITGEEFTMAFHHIGARFNEDLESYEAMIESFNTKGYPTLFTAGIEGISRFAYFDTEAELGHYLELIYFNTSGMEFMERLSQGEF